MAICQGTPMRHEIEKRAPGMLADVTARVAEAVAARFGTGPASAKTRAHVVTATG